jgi:hypothetical protein
MNPPGMVTLGQAVDLILAAPAPVLFIDTCILLDIIRAPLRGHNRIIEAAARLAEHAALEPPRLHVLITSTIDSEWAEHVARVRAEVERELQAARRVLDAMRDACRSAGLTPPRAPSARYADIPRHLTEIATRLHRRAIVLGADDQCTIRAYNRHVRKLPPAQGGEQIKDCVIIEHFLQFCADLRLAGLSEKCVFASSNTRDYCEGGSRIHPHLGIEFTAVNLRFVADLAWGRHELGLP